MPIWIHATNAFLLGQQTPLITYVPMFLAIGFLFYFLIIRPEKKKQSAVAQMQEGLKKNDRVVTVGGILGVVVNTQKDSHEVTIRVDENNNTRLHVLRSSISRVLSDEKSLTEENGK